MIPFLLFAAVVASPAGVAVTHPWSRPASAGGVAAGYMTLANTGKGPVTLVGIASPAADRPSAHKSTEANGVYSMTPVPALTIPPGGSVAFAPGGYHLMFSGLKTTLSPG